MNRLLISALIWGLIGSATVCYGQEDFRFHVPFRLEIGGNFSDFEDDSLNTWNQGLGSAFSLASGFGVQYKERFNLSAEVGILLDNYTYWITQDSVQYFLTNFLWEARINAHYLWPIEKDPSLAIHVGSDMGWTFYNDDSTFDIEPQYFSESEAFGPAAFMIAPEVGISKTIPQGQCDLLLSYAYHFRNQPTIKTRLYTEAGGDAWAEAKGDYFGLKLRFQLNVDPRRKPEPIFPEPPLETRVMELRDSHVVDRLKLDRDYVTLILWDNSKEDGDSVSVKVDKHYVLHELLLTNKKQRVRIPIAEGEHVITVMAHNEGSIPPNTASCKLRSGLMRKSYSITTSLKRNAVIEIERISTSKN